MLVLAIFVAGFFLIAAVFLMKKVIEGSRRGREEDSVVVQVLNSMQKELEELRLKQVEDASKLREELRDGMARAQSDVNARLESGMKLMMDNLTKISGELTERLGQSQKLITDQLQGTVKIIGDVKTTLGTLAEQARRMKELGEDVSKLQEILRSPKLRGSVGEVLLEDMLRQVIPEENYSLQYQFRSGERVDAVIRLGGHIIPIDSKFPLESFERFLGAGDEAEKRKHRRDFVQTVKRRIDEIAERYIRPEEGTYDFALMYVPAENIYYEIILRKEDEKEDLYGYALRKRVVPVSPNSFYAYLVAIAFGLKGFRIEKEAMEIRGRLEEIVRGLAAFGEVFEGLGKNIDLAARKYDDARKRLQKVETRLEMLTGLGEIEGD
ncbi:MAG: DNA recombination protein RmuC [Deltaproteobacteria bacterium]|nr:MAG: DNA recombination protein RmuC [Deltaproteobacteria bacterium]